MAKESMTKMEEIKHIITSIISTPGTIGLSGKCRGKKKSFIVTFFIATADTPALFSVN